MPLLISNKVKRTTVLYHIPQTLYCTLVYITACHQRFTNKAKWFAERLEYIKENPLSSASGDF
jgi:hypothetical protein